MQKQSKRVCSMLVLSLLALSMLPLMVKSSTGTILINTTTAPSTSQNVPAGGTINLYFGGVTFSGGQFYLLLSKDGFSQVSSGDVQYSPTFDVADLRASAVKTVDSYKIGYNWVNGSIPKDIAGGKYYIKAFDGATTAVAVTDIYITVIASFEVTPTSGPGGQGLTLKGYAFTASNYVNLTYNDPVQGKNVTITTTMLLTDSLGRFTYTMNAPDLGQALPAGDNPIASNTITFYAKDNKSQVTYAKPYAEYKRGLLQVDTKKPTMGLFGNNTLFTAGALLIEKGVGKTIILAGQYFSPVSAVTILWDAVTQIGSKAANQTGFFNITVTIPVTGLGSHKILFKDAKINFFINITIVQSMILSPTKGPVGTTVTATGYGFHPRTASTVWNVTLWWDWGDSEALVWVLTDTAGSFTTTFKAPHAAGGDHTVTPIENGTAIYVAEATFTITPTLVVMPSTFPNDGRIVNATGTGFDPDDDWFFYIDNHMIAGDDEDFEIASNGDIVIEFVAAYFSPGLHSVSAIREDFESPYEVEAYGLFNVTGAVDTAILQKLDAINATATDAKTAAESAEAAAMEAKEAADAAAANALDAKNVATDAKNIATDAKTAATDAKAAATAAQSAATDAKTAATAAQTAAAGAQSTASGISTAAYGAMGLSLVAAIAAILAVIQLQRKVAG